MIIPGGGYVKLAHEISGIALAKWYNTLGVTAFVLIHRFPQSPDVIESYKAPLQDGQRALRYIRAHAEEYGIDIHKVGVMGVLPAVIWPLHCVLLMKTGQKWAMHWMHIVVNLLLLY